MTPPNQAMANHWGGQTAEAWIALEATQERVMAPVTEALVGAAGLGPGRSVLDIGCGTGASTLEAARRVAGAPVTGLDISPVMLDRARTRAAEAGLDNITYIQGDAQVHGFGKDRAEVMISRFGMMFFEDPVRAFRNLASGLRPGAPLTFICWADRAANPWFSVPDRVVSARLGPAPPADPHAPGPFAFADADRVVGLMTEAGIADAGVEVLDIALATGLAPQEMTRFTALGPIGGAMRDRGGTEDDRAAMQAAFVTEMEAYATPEGVTVPGRFNLFRGRAA